MKKISRKEALELSTKTLLDAERERELLNNFSCKLLLNMTDMPPEFARVVDDHFWELLA